MKNIIFLKEIKNSLISKVYLKLVIFISLTLKNLLHIAELGMKSLLIWGNKKQSIKNMIERFNSMHYQFNLALQSERGDVPGWVLVVLMTTGLVTGIWTVAQPRLSSILKNSLDNMNSIR